MQKIDTYFRSERLFNMLAQELFKHFGKIARNRQLFFQNLLRIGFPYWVFTLVLFAFSLWHQESKEPPLHPRESFLPSLHINVSLHSSSPSEKQDAPLSKQKKPKKDKFSKKVKANL